jgi:hypothetical protein
VRWERVDKLQITTIEGNPKEGYCIEVLSPRGTLLHGPRGIDGWLVEKCEFEYGFKRLS